MFADGLHRQTVRTALGAVWILIGCLSLPILAQLVQRPWPATAAGFERGLWMGAGVILAGTGRLRRLNRFVGAWGHEHTHALADGASGARVYSISVGEGEGAVSLSKTNAFIALAPYSTPLLSLLAAALLPWLEGWQQTIAGFVSGTFYLLFWEDLIATLHVGQPDIQDLHMPIFATVTIAARNLVSLLLLLSLVLGVSPLTVWGFLREALVDCWQTGHLAGCWLGSGR
jgi:hypothetical protein